MSDNQPPGTRFWPQVTFEKRRVLQTQLCVKAKLWGHLKAKRLLSSSPPQRSSWILRTDWTDCLGLNLDFINHQTFPLFIWSAWRVQLVLVPVIVFPFLPWFRQLYWELVSPCMEPQSRCFLHWEHHPLLPSSFVSHMGSSVCEKQIWNACPVSFCGLHLTSAVYLSVSSIVFPIWYESLDHQDGGEVYLLNSMGRIISESGWVPLEPN